jgi:protocatechuate 3,4-dioxygenase beta subunit
VDESNLEIAISDNAASVTGVVHDDDQKPVPGAFVLLAPEPPLRDRDDLYATAPTDENGRFQLRGLTPGDYEVYAWQYAEAITAYRDPDFLGKYQTRGKSIHLEPGATVMTNPGLLP